jgi:hypothetical protein
MLDEVSDFPVFETSDVLATPVPAERYEPLRLEFAARSTHRPAEDSQPHKHIEFGHREMKLPDHFSQHGKMDLAVHGEPRRPATSSASMPVPMPADRLAVMPSPILKRAATAPSINSKSTSKVVFKEAVETRTIQPSLLDHTDPSIPLPQRALIHTPTSARKPTESPRDGGSKSPKLPSTSINASSLSPSEAQAAVVNMRHLVIVQSCVRRWLQMRKFSASLKRHRAARSIQALWYAIILNHLKCDHPDRRGFKCRAADPSCAAVRREIRTRRIEAHIISLNDQVLRLVALFYV